MAAALPNGHLTPKLPNGIRIPTNEERIANEARQERRDQISKLMGDYLLKGYKMLNAYCDQCTTILLESRAGVEYCVACSEVDAPVEPVRPAVVAPLTRPSAPTSSSAAPPPVMRSLTADELARVMNMRDGDDVNMILNGVPTAEVPPIQPVQQRQQQQPQQPEAPPAYVPQARLPQPQHQHGHACMTPMRVIQGQLEWATRQLHAEENLERKQQLVIFIGECAKTAKSLSAL